MVLQSLKGGTATGPGGSIEVGPRNAIQITGIVAGDEVEIEESINSVDWEIVGAAHTADGTAAVSPDGYIFRANRTANAGGGDVKCWLSNGQNEF